MKRFVAVCLMVAVLLCSIPSVYADDILQQQPHQEIRADSLMNLGVDQSTFEELAWEIMELAEDKKNLSDVSEKLQQLREWYQIVDTKVELCSIASYRDVTDEEASQEYLDILDYYYAADELMGQVVPAVLDSPCEDAIDRQDSVFFMFLWGSGGYTEDDLDLFYEEEALLDQYYEDLNQDFTVTYQGKTYTQESADEAWYNWDISDEDYDQILLLLAQAQNAALADYYIALVENRHLQAESYGYRDTASFYDEAYYYRDISRREREALYDAVKMEIVPLLRNLEERMYDAYPADYQDVVYSQQELLDTLETVLLQVSSEFSPALSDMKEFGYYDIAPGDNKMEGAFTTYLSYPNMPYLFMNPTGTSYDFTTIVHEFGHFNAFYVSPDPNAYNLDLAEIHSQGLELLVLPHYETIFGAQAEVEELNTVYAIVMSLVDGCMFDELERYAYETEDLTVEDMNLKYMELLKEYGYRDAEDPENKAYGWVITSHLFGYPMYYLSYAVSAAASLEIWESSLVDYEGAMEDYLTLVSLGETGTFYGALEEIGLEDPLSHETILRLADAMEQTYGLSPRGDSGYVPEDDEENLTLVLIILGILTIIWLAVTAVVMCWAVKKEKKRHAEYRKYLYYRAALAAQQGPGSYRGGGSTASSAGGEAWGREGGAADALPAPGDTAVSGPEDHEAPGSEC